jgi:ABC-type glycerol-3-phosphate transport system permease component
MPLVGKVGRKSARARFAMAMVYGALLLGAVTTVYPFLIMVSTGMAGPTDQNENQLVPSYFQDAAKLEAKYLDDKYSGNVGNITALKALNDASADPVATEKILMSLPPTAWQAGFRTAPTQVTSKLSLRYQQWLRAKFGEIDKLNKTYIEENLAFQTVMPPIEQLDKPNWTPRPGQKWVDWLEFKQTLPAEFRMPILPARLFQEFARTQSKNDFAQVPPEIAGEAKAFEELQLSRIDPTHQMVRSFWEKSIPPGLKGTPLASMPQGLGVIALDQSRVKANPEPIKKEFAGRNYYYVLDYIALNGRALWNTLIFCGLAILVQVLVNPIAAYALSRFPMPKTAQILIFLLATMAFPAEVAMIPSFLLLKDLGMLNTFWALILPGAASGYMIFLLKGFFDSLPKELFESGQLDGAKEWMMMMKIAFPLSRPVIGYLALLAFMASYGAFMYAFLVCQDRNMWTLMVFIYQLQNTAPKAVMMAAVTLAAIPTLLVFLACQRVIMRGIVLPGER